MSETSNNSPVPAGVGAVTSKNKIVIVTIFKKDRDWINETKGQSTRAMRLHDLITKAKELGL